MIAYDLDENNEPVQTQLNNMEEINMEEQTKPGNLKIGTIESENTKLEPKNLKIVSYEVKPVEKAKNNKVEFEVKHPDRDETIRISSVAYLGGKSVKTSGAWLTLDTEGNIQKDCALATLLKKLEASKLEDTKGKECASDLDEKGYLCFKAY